MSDENRTRAQLIEELEALRRSVGEWDTAEIPRQRVISQVREEVWKMQRPGDIKTVLEGVKKGLAQLEISFQGIGINIVDPHSDPSGVLLHSLTEQGEWIDPDQAWGGSLIYQFWREGRPVYRPDLEAEDVYHERELFAGYFGHAVRAVLDIPFSHGTLAINSARARAFSEQDIAVLQEMARILSEGFARIEDFQSLERRAQEAESLAAAIAVVAETDELDEVFHIVVREATRLMSVERSTLFLYDEEEGVLVPRAQIGHDWEVYRKVRLLPGEDMSGRVFATGTPFLIEGEAQMPPARRSETDALFEQSLQEKTVHGGAAVPLLLAGRVIGTLAVGTTRRQLTQRDVGMLERLGEQAALAIDRVRRAEVLEQRNRELEREIAERQRREAQRLAQLRMREEVWKMQGAEEIRKVLEAVGGSLEALEIPYQDWGINVVDIATDPPVVRFHNMAREGKWRIGELPAMGRDQIVKVWQSGVPLYRRDLAQEDSFRERKYIGRGFGHTARSVIDVPFSHGTLVVNSVQPEAFSEQDIATLQEMAEVLSEGFRRMDDLQQLTAERERLLVTLRSIGDGVIATDAEGKVVLVNRVAEMLTGWDQEEAEGKSLDEVFRIVDERTRQPCADPVAQVMEHGLVVGLANHTALIARDGSERSIADSGAPIRDRESRIIGAVLVFRDVTAERKMETELLKTEKLESLGVLAGGIAHDFNNILTTIIGSLSLSRIGMEETDPLYEVMAEVEGAARRASQLTQQLLTFAKGGAPVKKTASIAEIIEHSATFVLRGSNVRGDFTLPRGLWPVEVDAGQISQVIQNLVINADQAMPEGGVLHVEVQNVEAGAGRDPLLKEGRYVEIAVVDQGVGIGREHLQRIFEPYFTTKQKGSGLGLATSYAIVTNHDGHIGVESEIGVGTTFRIYLPALLEEAQLERAEEKIAPLPGQGRVLVMDDEPAIRAMAGQLLEFLGYEVAYANDGAEALDEYQAALDAGRPFAVVIMDLTIPGGMGGKEAIEKLLEIDPRAKAIVSSGYSNDAIMADFGSYGFKEVVAKPYSVHELEQVMARVVNP